MITRRGMLKTIAGMFGVASVPRVKAVESRLVRVTHVAASRYETSPHGYAYDVTPGKGQTVYAHVVRLTFNAGATTQVIGHWNEHPFYGFAPGTLMLTKLHGKLIEGMTRLRYAFVPCVPFDAAANPGVKVVPLYGSADFSKLGITGEEWDARTNEEMPPGLSRDF